ncbi:MAG: tRNA dihydrouridine synthase DusB [Spirochaetaceae bacterium]|jgi:nifR3 family TIM-barrel protein|nr:tRNA dihydrouridine synthase DusB [Spirochaetaceae bacterium]
MKHELYHPLTIGPLELDGNLFLAPAAGYTDCAFRSICVEYGANLTFTGLISAEALTRRADASETLLRRAENEKVYAVQLFGASEQVMAEAAVLLTPYKPGLIDINAGCPVPKVTRCGAGAALMRSPEKLARTVEAVVKIARDDLGGIPVSVKLRSGWDASSINFAECALAAVQAGACMVSLHARTRAQGYSGQSCWRHIAELAALLSVPVVGSGDLYSAEDAALMLKETGCAAVMFARGAFGNPFIFTETRNLLLGKDKETPDAALRATTALRQLELLAEAIGETGACLEMRKVFCAYTKGLHGAAPLRARLVHAKTIDEYRSLLKDFFDKQPASEFHT